MKITAPELAKRADISRSYAQKLLAKFPSKNAVIDIPSIRHDGSRKKIKRTVRVYEVPDNEIENIIAGGGQ